MLRLSHVGCENRGAPVVFHESHLALQMACRDTAGTEHSSYLKSFELCSCLGVLYFYTVSVLLELQGSFWDRCLRTATQLCWPITTVGRLQRCCTPEPTTYHQKELMCQMSLLPGASATQHSHRTFFVFNISYYVLPITRWNSGITSDL